MEEMQQPEVTTNEVMQTEQAQPIQENNEPVEVTETEEVSNQEPTQATAPTMAAETPEVEDVGQLKKKLEEYELRDNELKELSQKLGVSQNEPPEIMNAKTQLATLNNQIMQQYVAICNKYGVDFRPEKIDASSQALYDSDRNKYYDLQHELQQLSDVANQQRSTINNYIYNQQVTRTLSQYNDFLNASPAMKQAAETFISSVQMPDPSVAIKGFFDIATPLYKEAFEYGKLYAQQQALAAKQTPDTVLNNNSIVQSTASAPQAKSLTMDDIAKMDLKTYAKYASQIDKMRSEGLLK